MSVRHIATVVGLIGLFLVVTLGLARKDNPAPYMIVTDTSGHAFLYHETTGNLISVTAGWGDYTFSDGRTGVDKYLYAIIPDGWLVMGYGTTSSPLRTASFKFNAAGTVARPIVPGESEASLLTVTPDEEWMILSSQGHFYRQRVGSDAADLITERAPLSYFGWLANSRMMIVVAHDDPNSLSLLDFRTGEMQSVEMGGAFVSLTPSFKPGWFLLQENSGTGQAIYHVNFTSGERVALLPPGDEAVYVAGLDASGQFLIYVSVTNQTSRELWRVDQQNHIDLLVENTVFAEWSPYHTILLVFTEKELQRELWLIPADSWQPFRVYTALSRNFDFGYWLDDGFLILDGHTVIFASNDGSSWNTLYNLPTQRNEVVGWSPDDEWLMVWGQDASFKNWLFKIRPDGSQVQMVLPKEFDFGGFRGWLSVESFDWHFLPLLGVGVVLLLAGGRSLRRS
ncbi:MAG: hypothetical protein L0154_04425 [Chloroflexi bacterium]|nr:hypothetical protein [Chloroflexota bacterium]